MRLKRMPARARYVYSKSELARQTWSEQLDRVSNRQMVNARQVNSACSCLCSGDHAQPWLVLKQVPFL